MKDDYKSKGYAGKDIPLEKYDMTRMKDSTIDLYMKEGYPCGDVGDVEDEDEIRHNSGAGNVVGGDKSFGIHHKFENGIPNEGREDISAEVMKPEHKENVKWSVFDTIGEDPNPKAANKSHIEPYNMGIHNTFGIK